MFRNLLKNSSSSLLKNFFFKPRCYIHIDKKRIDDVTFYTMWSTLSEEDRKVEAMTSHFPYHPEIYMYQGFKHKELGDPISAIRCYRKAMEMDPNFKNRAEGEILVAAANPERHRYRYR